MAADREPDPRHERYVVLALLAALGLALLLLAATTPWTPDEGTYLDAGRLLVHRLDWEPYITYAHGPLPFYANQLLSWAVATDPPQDYRLAGRVGMLGFALLAAWSTNRLARAAFGPTAGLFALALFALNPVLLGHGCLMATDMSLVGFYVLCVHGTWRYLETPSVRRLAWIGSTLGLALATKYLGVFLIPVLAIALLAAVARGFRPGLWLSRTRTDLAARSVDAVLSGAICALVAWIVLWACYAFAPPGYAATEPPMSRMFTTLIDIPGMRTLLGALPEPWVRGVDYMKSYAESGGESYLLGHIGDGHVLYYLVALLTKLPIVVLLLVPLGVFRRAPAWPARLRVVFGLGIVVPFAYLSLFQVLQIGLRHMMQVLPLLCVLAARPLSDWWRRGARGDRRLGRALVAGCFAWLIGCHAITWPDYIPAFNSFVGDRPYMWFRDSNLVWRGDLEPDPDELEIRRRHPDARRVFTASGPRFGRLVAYAPDLLQVPDDAGHAYHWLLRFSPIDRAGAWYAFEIDEESFADACSDDARPDRCAAELAAALAGAGEARRALAALGDASGPLADAVRSAAALTTAGATDGPEYAAVLQLLGRFDLLANHQGASRLQRAFAHVSRLENARARDLLADAADLAPAEALLLALAHLQLNEHAKSLAVLERYRQADDAPLAQRFAELEATVRAQYELALPTRRRLDEIR